MKAAIRTEDPVVFLEKELRYGRSFDVPDVEDFVLPIGKARTMRKGSDVTIVSYSIGVGLALEAADQLAGEGIDAEVIRSAERRVGKEWVSTCRIRGAPDHLTQEGRCRPRL